MALGLASLTNRRKHQRVRPRSDVPVEVQIVGTNFIEELRARDISEGGIAVLVPHHFDGCDTHSEVQLVVKLPNQKAFLTRGIIRNLEKQAGEPGYFSLEFTKINPDDVQRLRSYVEKRVAEGGAS